MNFNIFSFGQHRHRNRRSMDSTLSLGGRYALDTMGATFKLQSAISPFAMHHGDDFFQTANTRGMMVHDFHFPISVLRKPAVHAIKVAGEQGCLLSTGAGPDFENNVFLIIRVFG